jgi:hypothetical protein
MKKRTTDAAIEDLVVAACNETTTAREKHMYREALRGLVRLARSDQMFEMRSNVNRLTAGVASRAARRKARAVLLAQRRTGHDRPGERLLEFHQG